VKVGDLECMVIGPTEADATACVIWCHGLGASGQDFVPFMQQLAVFQGGAVRVVLPHAPVRPVSINQGAKMRAWFDVHGLSVGCLQDEAGIQHSTSLLMRLIDHEVAQGVPAENIVLGGFSQGGMMALHAGLRYSSSLAGLVCLSGALLYSERCASETHALNSHTPVFIGHGVHDQVLPHELGAKAQSFLAAQMHPVAWHDYAMDHAVCAQEMRDVDGWLQSRLLGY
jgi:phospholipase/carboxylesterase